MTTFTIDADNNITAYAAPEQAQDALALGAQIFTSQKDLAKLAADWPTSRLVETWNGFAGMPGFDDLKPVKKFTDRATAVNRIWQSIQKLAPAEPQGAQDAPEAGDATTEASPKKNAPKTKTGANVAKARRAKKATTAEPRPGTKKAKVLDLIRRDKGATNEEIQRATDWQAHSIRGFISVTWSRRWGSRSRPSRARTAVRRTASRNPPTVSHAAAGHQAGGFFASGRPISRRRPPLDTGPVFSLP